MSPAPTGTLFTFRLVPLINSMLAQRGIDGAALLAEVGLPAEALYGEITAPLVRIQQFIELAARRTENPAFGLEIGERVPTGAYGVAEFVIRSAPTMRASLDALCELAPLINPIGDFRFVSVADGGELHYSVLAQRDTLGCHLNEQTISVIVRQYGLHLGHALPLSRAWFSHGRRSHGELVAQRLGTHVTFQAADCGFALSHETLALGRRTSDPPLFSFLLAQARAQLANLGTHDVISQVIRVVEVRLGGGDVGVGAIAQAMATTARSLQRHLADAGTSFREVVVHVRRRRRGELVRAGLSESAAAHALGFADSRSMRRALDG